MILDFKSQWTYISVSSVRTYIFTHKKLISKRSVKQRRSAQSVLFWLFSSISYITFSSSIVSFGELSCAFWLVPCVEISVNRHVTSFCCFSYSEGSFSRSSFVWENTRWCTEMKCKSQLTLAAPKRVVDSMSLVMVILDIIRSNATLEAKKEKPPVQF